MSDEACDTEIYDKGEAIWFLACEKPLIERAVQAASKLSEQKMDWHYVGGRGVVRVLGDREKAEKSLAKVLSYLTETGEIKAGETLKI
jgi:uncharacterized protein YlxP (DUF503 family)